jgi:hypothetical protein
MSLYGREIRVSCISPRVYFAFTFMLSLEKASERGATTSMYARRGWNRYCGVGGVQCHGCSCLPDAKTSPKVVQPVSSPDELVAGLCRPMTARGATPWSALQISCSLQARPAFKWPQGMWRLANRTSPAGASSHHHPSVAQSSLDDVRPGEAAVAAAGRF